VFDRRQKINLACALACAGMLGYAIYAEKYLGYLPCPLCMFQRVGIGTLGLVLLIAGLHPARKVGAAIYGVLIFLATARCLPAARRWTRCSTCFRCSKWCAR
jgi:disulfide bond formation protein DsbB